MNFPRETTEKLELYWRELQQWNQTFNLIGKSTQEEGWDRHILDCAQLSAFLPDPQAVIVDFGSGAGLPGLVLSILGYQQVHLIESSNKKVQFLNHIQRMFHLPVVIHGKRAEEVDAFAADVITARAFADLSDILAYAQPFSNPKTIYLCLKGEKAGEEIEKATRRWSFQVEKSQSITSPTGTILRLRDVQKKVD